VAKAWLRCRSCPDRQPAVDAIIHTEASSSPNPTLTPWGFFMVGQQANGKPLKLRRINAL
jgi:hypothetical protein